MTKFIDVSQESKKEKQKTIFTHYQCENGWAKAPARPEEYHKILYLGFCKNEKADIFAAFCRNETISIYKGIKGDEFNQ